jgi:sterol desaturase/sphingolipid hydroxylase (fatty acid hydroxylase superfamily)
MLSMASLEKILQITRFSAYTLVGLAILHGLLVIALKRREKSETLCNIGIYAGYSLVKNLLTASLTLTAFSFVYRYRIFAIPNTILAVFTCIMLADFLYYWKHRLEHRSRILWVAHATHHSSHEFNLSTALRLPWLSPLYSWAAYAPLCLLGFHPIMVIMAAAVVLTYQFLIHTELVGRHKWLDSFLNSPSNHRVHHGSNAEYLDRNYAGIFMFWDHLFGTYAKEQAPVRYGLTTPINTTNPAQVNFMEVAALLKDLSTAKKFRTGLKVLLGPPGTEK